MKLAVAVILALAVSMVVADTVGKVCPDTTTYWNSSSSSCVACSQPNCTECVVKNGQQSCLNCGTTSNFLGFDGDIGSCKPCAANCSQCRGPAVGDCYAANADSLVSPSVIVKCTGIANCQWCSSENTCGKCQLGFRLDKNTCTACTSANCATCASDIAKCDKCASMNALNNGTCTPCSFGCTACPCTACMQGFRFSNATCTLCNAGPGCTACPNDVAKCTACADGSYLKTDACVACGANCAKCTGDGQCSACNTGFGLLDGKTCTACPANCGTCDGAGVCSSCNSGYVASADKKTCVACIAGCDSASCQADGTCTKCIGGFWLSDDKKTCSLCAGIHCTACASATKCQTCDSASVVNGDSCKGFSECARGQALDAKAVCQPGTVENCVYGNNATGACVQCATGYIVSGNTCGTCPNGCKSCSADSKGYISCNLIVEQGYSITTNKNGKADNVGYLGKDVTYTVDWSGNDKTCMPNTFLATFTQSSTKRQCILQDNCKILTHGGAWGCVIEGNAAKIAMSFVALVVASLFTL